MANITLGYISEQVIACGSNNDETHLRTGYYVLATLTSFIGTTVGTHRIRVREISITYAKFF
jgi:hypothetical protein